ncbi:radical SAM protein [Alkalidesulfovibrio alkalitolerans]|nr:radical SAM protein [Alkalidesulfovibrio alkalitolerans]
MSVRTVDWIEIHAVDHCNNNCRWCNNHSPFAKERFYEPEEYFHGLDELRRRRINFNVLSIIGGEPFLHPELENFIFQIKSRYCRPIMLTTNIFWLSEIDVVCHLDLLKLVDILNVTLYPNIVKSLGGYEAAEHLLSKLRALLPKTNVKPMRIEHVYRKLEFTREKMIVDKHCYNAECTNLMADGRLARCGPGAYAHLHPDAPREFCESKDMFYDLKSDKRDFWHWKHQWPLDACAYCNHFQAIKSPWKVEKGVLRKKRYESDYKMRIADRLAEAGAWAQAGRIYLAIAEETGPDSLVYGKISEAYRNLGQPVLAEKFLNLSRKVSNVETAQGDCAESHVV